MRFGRACIFIVLVLVIASSQVVRAESVGKLVAKGNKKFAGEDYDGAMKFYEEASVKAPESPIVFFNMGDVLFMKGRYDEAREKFQEAAEKTKDLHLEALSWYNTGNCAFKQAERQMDSDLRKALDYYRESIQFYQTALEKDPELKEAAYNLEVTRLVVKDLLDRIKRQEEEMKKQQERMKAVVDSLRSLIRTQKEVMDKTKALSPGDPSFGVKAGNLKEKQEGIAAGTRGVQSMLDTLFSGKKPPQVSMANSHLDSATVAQYNAVGELSKVSLKSAVGNEGQSLKFLVKALEDLTSQSKGENRGGGDRAEGSKEGKSGEKQEKKKPVQKEGRQQNLQKAARDETARAILDEEKENRKRRQRALAGGYRPVEKDW